MMGELLPQCMMGSEVLLLLLSLMMSSVCSSVNTSGGAVLCPLQCVCETRPWYTPQSVFHQAQTVDCNELHLTRVPPNISMETQVLLLQSNNISTISFELQSLTNLTELDLSQNHITEVSSLDLSSLSRLVTLYLEENLIEDLLDFGLRNLSSLEELYINHNRIRAIQPQAFSGLTNLLRLHLNSNRLESIDGRWFDSLPALEILMLGENPVLGLDPGAFRSLPRLHSLVLASLGLTSVSAAAFTGLDCLESLSFYDNKLRSVPKAVLKVLPNLKFLDLNRNPINRIRQRDFSDLPHLQEISVNNMDQLQMVEQDSFRNLPELIKLELTNNHQLSYLHPQAFSGVPFLRSLLLHGSSLSFLSSVLVSSLSSLSELSLHSNPLRCDCLLTWASHLGINSSHHAHLTLLEPTLTLCHAPPALIGQELQEVVASGGGADTCLPQISTSALPSAVNVSEGQPISIECWADADPAPQYYWVTPTGNKVSSEAVAAPIISQEQPEGRGLSRTTSRHHVMESGTFVIDRAQASDTGTYTCVAWNSEGADTRSLSVFVELQDQGTDRSSEPSPEQPSLGSGSSSSASLVVLAKVVHSQSVVLEWKLYPSKPGPDQDPSQDQRQPLSLPRFTTATVHIHNTQISYTAKVPADVQEYNLTHLTPSTLYHVCLTISSSTPPPSLNPVSSTPPPSLNPTSSSTPASSLNPASSSTPASSLNPTSSSTPASSLNPASSSTSASSLNPASSSKPPPSLNPASHTSCLNVTTSHALFSVEPISSRRGGVALAAILGSLFALSVMAMLLFHTGRRGRVVNAPLPLKKYMATSIPLNQLYPPLITLWDKDKMEDNMEDKIVDGAEEGQIDTSKTYMW